jgi:hypothetical protein
MSRIIDSAPKSIPGYARIAETSRYQKLFNLPAPAQTGKDTGGEEIAMQGKSDMWMLLMPASCLDSV